MAAKSGKLLIYAPVPLIETDSGLMLEKQACNGLRLWAEHFDELVSMHPVSKGPLRDGWRPIEEIGPSLDRIRFVPLPMAYRPRLFLRHYSAIRNVIRSEIDAAEYMSFAIGAGLSGDWGAVACMEAHRAGRPFAVWTDRVESEVVRRTSRNWPLHRRLRARIAHRPMWWRATSIIRRASLGLFHGRETFDTYARYCREPQMVHNIHLGKSDHIAPADLKAKIDGAGQGPLKIVYTGRANAMKGPQDWVAVLERLAAQGIHFEATWLGDGPELADMKARVAAAGLENRVRFAGFVTDRKAVMDHLRAAHLFLFCHKTPESPRCLIEALVSATPTVGYKGAFAQDLISHHGGGRLVPLDDVQALSEAVADLARHRSALSDLIARASKDGGPFDEDSVYRHRSDVIRQYLSPAIAAE